VAKLFVILCHLSQLFGELAVLMGPLPLKFLDFLVHSLQRVGDRLERAENFLITFHSLLELAVLCGEQIELRLKGQSFFFCGSKGFSTCAGGSFAHQMANKKTHDHGG
jgi:hypothetical protein